MMSHQDDSESGQICGVTFSFGCCESDIARLQAVGVLAASTQGRLHAARRSFLQDVALEPGRDSSDFLATVAVMPSAFGSVHQNSLNPHQSSTLVSHYTAPDFIRIAFQA